LKPNLVKFEAKKRKGGRKSKYQTRPKSFIECNSSKNKTPQKKGIKKKLKKPSTFDQYHI